MTIPVWILLAFAVWTLLTVGTTHGHYRLGRIFTGRSEFRDFAEYKIEGSKGWYTRGMRAHANCVENLPVYGAIAVAILATGADSLVLDVLAIVVMAARVVQTSIHVLLPQETNPIVGTRSLMFAIQWFSMLGMAAAVVVESL
jgi:uncharacterized MAPEG superfamily protein